VRLWRPGAVPLSKGMARGTVDARAVYCVFCVARVSGRSACSASVFQDSIPTDFCNVSSRRGRYVEARAGWLVSSGIGRERPGGPLKFAGFDYFIPGALYPSPTSPGYPGTPPLLEGLGTPLMWNDAHAGWIAHIWLWEKNPDGIFENFNSEIELCECQISPAVPLCTP
jgi:hypothetical protein